MTGTKFQMKSEGSHLYIGVSGAFHERTEFPKVAMDFDRVEIDLGGLEAINSAGIRGWIDWMNSLGPRLILLQNCPGIFIQQVNMIDGFLPEGALVNSFIVDYYCPEDESEYKIRWIWGKHYKDGNILEFPPAINDKGRPLQLDVPKEKFFRFLKRFS